MRIVEMRRGTGAVLALMVCTSTAAIGQAPPERFRGTELKTAPVAGVTATTRGRDAFSIRVTDTGLAAVAGSDASAHLGSKLFNLRVGSKLTEDLLDPCNNESVRDAERCSIALPTKRREDPFVVAFGSAYQAMPGEYIVRAYLSDSRYPGVYGACNYLMPKDHRMGCAIVFQHGGDEYKMDTTTVRNTTDLGEVRCTALRLTQVVWADVKSFDHVCPGGK